MDRWTEYCAELYNHPMTGDASVLVSHESSNEDDFPITREEVEAAIKLLKNGEATGIDNIPGELIKHGGDSVKEVLTRICNNIRRTGEWPTTWTQSLVIKLPKKGNLKMCQTIERSVSLVTRVK